MSFIKELKRRNVIRVAIAYGVAAWLLIEITATTFPILKLPDWSVTLVTVLVLIGFPLALIFAWAFELTPEGLKKEKDVDRSESITHVTGRKLDFLIIGLLTVALGISIILHFQDDEGETLAVQESAADHLSIAVLPFTSRSTDPENSLFADGIHDDLLTTLAKIGSLKVISRTSVMEYRDTTKNLKVIGNELGVANVMEGAVQKFGNNVRINVQLIDANTDEHLWAETYDRELTTKNLFAIQSEISNEIATALKTTMTPEEQDLINTVRTENLEAYNVYLSGRSLMARRRLDDLRLARQQFEKAIELDPGFADAYSGLADSIMLLENNHSALSWDEIKDQVPHYLDTALSLDKQNANVYASLGLYKMTVFDREYTETAIAEAETAFARAIELNPNYAQAYFWFASIKWVQGLYEDSIALMVRALQLDPLARVPMLNLASGYATLGRQEDATAQLLKTIDLHADYGAPRVNLAEHLMSLGRFAEGLAWALEAHKLDPVTHAYRTATAYNALGKKDHAKAAYDGFPTDHPQYLSAQATIAQIDGDYEKAFELLKGRIESLDRAPWYTLGTAAIYAIALGDFETARDYLLTVNPELADRADPQVNWEIPVDTVALAYAVQRTGEPEYAELLLSRSLAMLESRPRMGLQGYGNWDVQHHAVMGDKETALRKLREAVDAGWRGYPFLNAWTLADNPFLESLWGEPEFKAIVTEVESDLARQRARVEAAAATGDWAPLLALARQTAVGSTRQ